MATILLPVLLHTALFSALVWLLRSLPPAAALLFPVQQVSLLAWATLHGVTTVLLLVLCSGRWVPQHGHPQAAGPWLRHAGTALLLALLFAGTNAGMDVLHGAQRPKAEVADALGGVQLWMVLAPGVACLCVAAAFAARLRQRRLPPRPAAAPIDRPAFCQAAGGKPDNAQTNRSPGAAPAARATRSQRVTRSQRE